MKLGIDKIQKYGLESFVILFSIVLSFYIEGQRDLAEKNSDKIVDFQYFSSILQNSGKFP